MRTCGAERSCKTKDALGKLTKIVAGVFKMPCLQWIQKASLGCWLQYTN